MHFPTVSLYVPSKYLMPNDFHLTDYSELKGCGCKVPRRSLLDLLSQALPNHAMSLTNSTTATLQNSTTIGIGLDACVVPLHNTNGYFLIQTVDFFAPLVDDPYLQV